MANSTDKSTPTPLTTMMDPDGNVVPHVSYVPPNKMVNTPSDCTVDTEYHLNRLQDQLEKALTTIEMLKKGFKG